jgi:hypothetical protein
MEAAATSNARTLCSTTLRARNTMWLSRIPQKAPAMASRITTALIAK